MNTVLKGDNYENECFILVKRLIDNLELPHLPSFCQVYQKRGYFSKDRESNIIFDISIEVWPKGATNYSLLYLIECKNYETKIPVNRIEQFFSKIRQVSGVNSKGVFISKSFFQEGAYRFARSKGMMLIQADNNITFNIILYKAERLKEIKNESVYIEKTVSLDEYQDPLIREYIHKKWNRIIEKKILQSFIFDLNVRFQSKEETIPLLTRKDINEFVNELLFSFDPGIAKYGKRIDWNEFERFIMETYDLTITIADDLGVDTNQRQILGKCSLINKTVEISKSIQGTERYIFILAHELGHYFLHNKITIFQSTYNDFLDSEYVFSIRKHQITNQRGWIEWQANAFASSLILPQEGLLYKLFIAQKRLGMTPGRPLYLDHQKCNRNDFNTIITELSTYFSTTKTSVIYRLKDMKFLSIDPNYSGRTVGEIIREIYPELLD